MNQRKNIERFVTPPIGRVQRKFVFRPHYMQYPIMSWNRKEESMRHDERTNHLQNPNNKIKKNECYRIENVVNFIKEYWNFILKRIFLLKYV